MINHYTQHVRYMKGYVFVVRNVEMEHNTPSVKSNPVKRLRDNIDHSFSWKVICSAPNRKLARKIL